MTAEYINTGCWRGCGRKMERKQGMKGGRNEGRRQRKGRRKERYWNEEKDGGRKDKETLYELTEKNCSRVQLKHDYTR